jgi:hypothetical protein
MSQKDSGSDSAPTPIPRGATTPSSHLRSVYRSTLPGKSPPTRSSGQRPPRKRLVSSETVQEEGGPFTLQQVTAATSFTIERTRTQITVTELPATPVVEPSPREDTGVRTSFEYHDQATQANPDFQDQTVQAEDSYYHKSVQVSPACKDQAIQVSAEYHDQDTQFTTHYIGQGLHSTSANESLQPGTTEPLRESSEAKGKRAFHDQALQTDRCSSKFEGSSVQRKSNSPGPSIHVVESEGDLRQAQNPGHIVISENPESHFSTNIAFFTARNCSPVSQTRRTGLLELGVLLDPDKITIELPEGARVHMLQRIRRGKIEIDPGVLPRAQSSEALAQGKLYTPGYVPETEAKPAAQLTQSASSASCPSASSSSSLEGNPTSPPKFVATEASVAAAGAADGSHYTEAKQQLTSQTHQSADEPDQLQKVQANTEATPPADEVAFTATSFSKPPNAADSSAKAAHRARVSGKLSPSSVSYWFESEDEDPNQAGSNTVFGPETLSQFSSVPLIRVQRPSTDLDMVFGLGTKAVKPSPSVSPLVPTADPTPVQTENVVLPLASLPTASTGGKKHFRDRLRDRSSKQAVPLDLSAGGKVGVRNRIKQKGRKKLILRKKVLRFLLGKELAERVSQDLDTAENTTRGATGVAQLSNDASGAVPNSAAWRPRFHEPALPLGVTSLAPAQIDGSDCRSAVSDQYYSEVSLDADMTPMIPALDGSDERRANHRARKEIKCQKKEQELQAGYEQAKTNLEALISTPCIKCGGQRAYILNFVWENKNKMIKHDEPDLKRRHRRKKVTEYVESIECRCPRGTSTAAYGSPEAVPRAKEMYGCHFTSFLLAKS